jgi:hypothetical protein
MRSAQPSSCADLVDLLYRKAGFLLCKPCVLVQIQAAMTVSKEFSCLACLRQAVWSPHHMQWLRGVLQQQTSCLDRNNWTVFALSRPTSHASAAVPPPPPQHPQVPHPWTTNLAGAPGQYGRYLGRQAGLRQYMYVLHMCMCGGCGPLHTKQMREVATCYHEDLAKTCASLVVSGAVVVP